MNETARDLLDAELCSPLCLMAREEGSCQCRCLGTYHGAMIDLEVPVQYEVSYPDMCRACESVPALERIYEPISLRLSSHVHPRHQTQRDKEWIFATYVCREGHPWGVHWNKKWREALYD